MSHSNIDRLLTDLYRAVESETISREFLTDEHGVTLLAGSQSTSYVWIAFRVATDTSDESVPEPDVDEKMTFRVIRLDPHRSESLGVSQRTGQVEKQSNFTGCQYMLGDVHVRPLTNRENFGTALRQIQEAFHNSVMRRPTDSGQIMGPRSLTNLYREWVADDFDA